MDESFEILGPDQVRYLEETAEKAREALSRFADCDVAYGSGAVELLDEWIERHLERSPDPSAELRLTWTSLLGEVIRRRFGGRWILQRARDDRTLAVQCESDGGYPRTIDLSGQLSRRIADGMSASLAYFYAATGIELMGN
ncbi:MAG: hypothetical protein E3J64_08380 [Anaerolineales bacterium]|nr:MAG: hypothetical protein E3J64_08380 [Anaerolineales bacterium]